MIEIRFKMRGEIIWNKGAGAGFSMAWGSWRSASNPVLRDTHEYILEVLEFIFLVENRVAFHRQLPELISLIRSPSRPKDHPKNQFHRI
jgi:site-specific DNA-methyltransferase (adenine-specific)